MDESLKAQLQATLDMVPAFTWFAAPSGALLFVNSRGADYLGLPKDHPLRFGADTGAAWDSHIPFLHPDDHEEARRASSDNLKTGSPGDVNVRIRNAEGNYRWFLNRTQPLRATDGTVQYWIGINLDIEERKRAEQELRDIVDTIPAIVWVARPDGSNAYANRRFVEYSGLVPAQAAGSGWRMAIHPDDLQKHEGKWHAAVASGKPHESEVRFRGAHGEYRWHLDRGLPLRDEEGNIIKWYGVVTDIEDRKRVEEALRRSEHGLAEAQRLSRVGSVGMDVGTKRIFWSEESARIYGYAPGTEPTPELILQRVHPEDVGLVQDAIERAGRGEDDFDYEHRLLMPDGSTKHIYNLAHCQRDEAGHVEVVGAIMDITERKVAEDAIRRSEAYLAAAQALSHTGSFGWKIPSGEIFWSDETFRIFECDLKTKPTVELVLSRVHPDDRALAQQHIDRALLDRESFDFEHRLQLPDGSVKHVRVTAHPSRDTGGDLEFVGAITDITQQRQAEAVIRTREAELRDVVDTIPAIVWTALPDFSKAYVNSRFVEYSGMGPEEIVGTGWHAATHPDDLERHNAKWLACAASGEPFEDEVRFRRSDGQYRWYLQRGIPLRDGAGHIVKWYGVLTDIEDRKRAEDRIRQQETELRQMLDCTPQIIVLVSPRRERLYANRFALAYLGVSLEEWRKGSFLTEVHPDDIDRVKALVDRSAAHPADYEWDLRLRKGDGTYRWFLIRYNPLRDDQGQLIRWYLACTDIDDRRRAEERLQQENVALREEIDKTSMFEEIVGASPALTAVLSRVSKVASSDSTVLISGETGTGKELVARAIHRRSRRASRAFVAVNCAAIPRDLIASELFGHEKGAFTGALQRRLGRFELADGGTIFLDEVGELVPDTQVALLRVLQEREFERVGGGQHPIRVDVRVIAATNRDLAQAVADGTFRQDLFYRLNVFPLEIPPLRERQDDIAVLVEYFINRYARKAGKTIRQVSKRTLDRLKSYPWPGNVRELQNVIERSVIVSDTDEFTVDESWVSTRPALESRLGMPGALASHEKELIEDALRASQGQVFGPSGAAARLGIPRSTLESKIRAFKINKSRFRTRTPKRS